MTIYLLCRQSTFDADNISVMSTIYLLCRQYICYVDTLAFMPWLLYHGCVSDQVCVPMYNTCTNNQLSRRFGMNWLAEIFHPYDARAYKGLVGSNWWPSGPPPTRQRVLRRVGWVFDGLGLRIVEWLLQVLLLCVVQTMSKEHAHISLDLQVVEAVLCRCPWCAVVCTSMRCAVLCHGLWCSGCTYTRACFRCTCSGSDVGILDLNCCLHRVVRDTEIGTDRDGCMTRVGVHLVTPVMQLHTLDWAGAYINGWGRREMETGVNDERVLSRRSAQPLSDTCACTTRTLFLHAFKSRRFLFGLCNTFYSGILFVLNFFKKYTISRS